MDIMLIIFLSLVAATIILGAVSKHVKFYGRRFVRDYSVRDERRVVKARTLKREREKREKQLKDLVEEMGPEIYEVFNKINHTKCLDDSQ